MEEIEKYAVKEVVGKGTYGVVYKAVVKGTNEIVAVKDIELKSLQEEGIPSTALREISLLQDIQDAEDQHKNIVKLLDVHYTVNPHRLLLIFEFVDYDLKKFMENCSSFKKPSTSKRAFAMSNESHGDDEYGEISMETVKSFAKQLLEGVNHCHSLGVIHRDLKPQNILVSNQKKLKIADFGLARALNIPLRTYTSEVVTLWYRCPELLLGVKKYSFAVDMWSLGCIIGELINFEPIFRGDSEIGQLFQIFGKLGTPTGELTKLVNFNSQFPQWTAKKDKIFELCPRTKAETEAGILLDSLLKYSPIERFLADEALQLKFFRENEDDDKENTR